jgi:hypothetical protein
VPPPATSSAAPQHEPSGEQTPIEPPPQAQASALTFHSILGDRPASFKRHVTIGLIALGIVLQWAFLLQLALIDR